MVLTYLLTPPTRFSLYITCQREKKNMFHQEWDLCYSSWGTNFSENSIKSLKTQKGPIKNHIILEIKKEELISYPSSKMSLYSDTPQAYIKTPNVRSLKSNNIRKCLTIANRELRKQVEKQSGKLRSRSWKSQKAGLSLKNSTRIAQS